MFGVFNRRSVKFKMSFCMALLIIFLMAAICYVNYYRTRAVINAQALDKGWSIVRSSTAFVSEQVLFNDLIGLSESIKSIRSNGDVSFVAISDSNGTILVHSDKSLVGRTIPLSDRIPAANNVHPYYSENGKVAGNRFIAPINGKGGSVIGYFQLGLDNARYELILKNALMDMLPISAAAVVASIMLAFILARRIISRPVADLKEATLYIAAGDFSHHAPVRRMDELGGLAAAFNSMTGYLANLFTSVRTSTTELTRSSQLILNRAEYFTQSTENLYPAGSSDHPGENSNPDRLKQMEALREINAAAKKMVRLADRLNSLTLQFKI